MTDRPIGLFDSGIGGLTVLRSLMTTFPNESFVYLGDTARLPYGNKSPDTIRKYLEQNIKFLVQQNVKAIIVACNSASTVLLEPGERHFPVPVYNVIEPGAAAALAVSVNKRIGVLGTKATVRAQSYANVLKKLDPSIEVIQQACPLLVPLVEEGWEEDPLTNLVIYRYVQPVLATGVDTLILGCTHYPALRGGIGRVAGPNVNLIDSSEAIGKLLNEDFSSGRLAKGSKRQPLRLMTTDSAPSFGEIAVRLMRPHATPPLETIDLT